MSQNDKRSEFVRLVTEAVALHNADRLQEAEAAYRGALQMVPDHAAVMHNLGVLAGSRNEHEAAIARFDAAIKGDLNYASAYYHRAVSMAVLGRRTEAIQDFARTVALEPDHYASHRALGFLLLAAGNRDRALDHLARTYELRRGEDRTDIASKSLTTANRAKLLHDAEQFRYLARKVRNGQRFEVLARNYEAVGRGISHETTTLTAADFEALGEDYNTAIHLAAAPEIPAGAIRRRSDTGEIARQFGNGPNGVVFFDGLLTPQALAALRRYFFESTIWHDFSHIGGFVASYLEDGLACPLFLQIADEMRTVFSDVLGPLPLTQAWAFKGLERESSVDIHADDADVTVNFWVTASEANLRPGRGGLVVCRTAPPADWAIRDYEADQERIVEFLERNAGDALVVPYRENRAVMFRSRLFHHSDVPEFASGYENHRINVTLLFGPTGRIQAARP